METLSWFINAIQFHAVSEALWYLIPILALFIVGLYRISTR